MATKKPNIKDYVDFQETTRSYNGKSATAYVPHIKKDTALTRQINGLASKVVDGYLNRKVWVPRPSLVSRIANLKSRGRATKSK